MARGRANWDSKITKIFLDLCIAEKEKFNFNKKKGLTKAGWQNVYRSFREKTKRDYDSKQLQNKFNSLKRQYMADKELKNATGGGWDNSRGIVQGDPDWVEDRIAEDPEAEELLDNPLAHALELDILFGTMNTEEGDMLCAGGIGDRTPSGGSEGYRATGSEDNVGRSGVGHVAQRPRKEQVVDSPPPKKTKSMDYYLASISESMLQRSRNETSAVRQEQEEVMELLKIVEDDGVDQKSEVYFIATELFRSAARRAAFRSLRTPDARIAWLRWTWGNTRKK